VHGSLAPIIHEFGRPPAAFVVPEFLEILLEKVGPDGFQVDGDKLFKFSGLVLRAILRSLKQALPTAGENRFLAFAFGFERFDLGCPYFINGLVHVAHDVEAIQNVESLAGLFGHD
jgi:hypothetical protein